MKWRKRPTGPCGAPVAERDGFTYVCCLRVRHDGLHQAHIGTLPPANADGSVKLVDVLHARSKITFDV